MCIDAHRSDCARAPSRRFDSVTYAFRRMPEHVVGRALVDRRREPDQQDDRAWRGGGSGHVRPDNSGCGIVTRCNIVTVLVTIHTAESASRRKWMALVVVCLGQLMMVVDMTIVNVALPVIQRDLRFSQADLTWVVGAYLISYGSFLLMAGRLGDLIGRKRVFLAGVALFTVASALCGLADDQLVLIAARFLQGLGGAIATVGDHRPHRHRLPAPRRARAGDGRLHVRRHLRRLARAAARRRARAVRRLALDLLRQRADRRGRARARRAADREPPGRGPDAAGSTSPARSWSRPR